MSTSSSSRPQLRTFVFWLHLLGALAAGLVIFVLCFTGASLAFGDKLTAWAERDVRRVSVPPSIVPLSPAAALARVRAQQPSLRITSLGISKDPEDAWVLQTADRSSWYLNPYTGLATQGLAPRTTTFLRLMGSWHVALGGALGTWGGPVTGAANVVFLALILSGLILWWPRTWKLKAIRPSIWFVRGLHGRARDWNWHQTVALWSFPVLLVLTSTGVVLSYRSVNMWIFRMAGEPIGANGRDMNPTPKPKLVAVPDLGLPKPTDKPGLDGFVAHLERAYPDWQEMDVTIAPAPAPAGADQRFEGVVKREHRWPWFTSTLVHPDPATGQLLERDQYSSAPFGRRLRMWIRLLHSGDAFGLPGKVVAGLACLAGCFLVWTGYSMAWWRFFRSAR